MAPPAAADGPVATLSQPITHGAAYGDYNQKLTEYDTKSKEFLSQLPPPKPASHLDVKHSGPQGKVEPLTIIDDPADWKAVDWIGREEEYTYHFTKDDIAEINASVDALKARGVSSQDDIQALTKADYSWPSLAPKLQELVKNVNAGRGFQLLKGFPVEQYKNDRLGLVLAYWGVALTLGRPQISQTDYHADGTVYGSLLNHITEGRWAKDYKLPGAFTDETRNLGVNYKRLQFHSDQGATDLISMLSIGAAKDGTGVSKWVSAVAIHNELLRRGRKDLVEVLSTPRIWLTARKASQQAYELDPATGKYAGYEDTVPFEYHDGYLSVHFALSKYQDVDLTDLQKEAMWAVAALAEDPNFHLSLQLQPGDIEWIHNPTTFHARTDVIDGDTPETRRHLLRFWVHTDSNPRPIAAHYAPRSNVNPEGGFKVPEGSKLRLPLYPYSRHDGQGQS